MNISCSYPLNAKDRNKTKKCLSALEKSEKEKILREQLQNVDFKKMLLSHFTSPTKFNQRVWQKQKQKTAQNAAVFQFRRMK